MALLLRALPLVVCAMQGSRIRAVMGFDGVVSSGSPARGKVESLLQEAPTMRSVWDVLVDRRQLLRVGQARVSAALRSDVSIL